MLKLSMTAHPGALLLTPNAVYASLVPPAAVMVAVTLAVPGALVVPAGTVTGLALNETDSPLHSPLGVSVMVAVAALPLLNGEGGCCGTWHVGPRYRRFRGLRIAGRIGCR